MRVIYPDRNGTVNLGRCGEKEATEVRFAVSYFYKNFGEDGYFALIHQRQGDTSPYPVAVTVEDGYVRWRVHNADVAKEGDGECELQYYLGETLAKSVIYKTKTARALDGAGDPPEPWESWIEDVEGYARDASEAAESAQQSAQSAEQFADTARGHAVTAGRYKDQAISAAEDASAYAQGASDAADRAGQYATNAQQSASAAEASAETAGQAARVAVAEALPETSNGAIVGYYSSKLQTIEPITVDIADRLDQVQSMTRYPVGTEVRSYLQKILLYNNRLPCYIQLHTTNSASAVQYVKIPIEVINRPDRTPFYNGFTTQTIYLYPSGETTLKYHISLYFSASMVSIFMSITEDSGSGTTDYSDLTNKPQINGVTLSGNQTGTTLGVIDAPSSPATGAFLVWDGSTWVAQTLAEWTGGDY